MLGKLLLLAFGLSLATTLNAASPESAVRVPPANLFTVDVCNAPKDNVECEVLVSTALMNTTLSVAVKQASVVKTLRKLELVDGKWSGNLLFEQAGDVEMMFMLLDSTGNVVSSQNKEMLVMPALLLNQDRRSIFDLLKDNEPGNYSEYYETPQYFAPGPLMEPYQED